MGGSGEPDGLILEAPEPMEKKRCSKSCLREPRYTVDVFIRSTSGVYKGADWKVLGPMGRTTGGARDNTNSRTPDDPKGSADYFFSQNNSK